MHDNRDGYIILMTLIPLVVLVAAFAVWNSSGSVALPGLPNLPNITLPNAPSIHIPVPGFANTTSAYLREHAMLMVPALLVGLVVGIFVGGTLVDVGRSCRQAWHRRSPVPSGDDDLLDDAV